MLGNFIYADADPLVRATQVLALIAYSLFVQSSLQDVVTGKIILFNFTSYLVYLRLINFMSSYFCFLHLDTIFFPFSKTSSNGIVEYVQLWKRFHALTPQPLMTKYIERFSLAFFVSSKEEWQS